MANWKKKEAELGEMNNAITQHPGISAAELARLLDLDRSTIGRRLPSLEEAGYLLYEDNHGGLYPFDTQQD